MSDLVDKATRPESRIGQACCFTREQEAYLDLLAKTLDQSRTATIRQALGNLGRDLGMGPLPGKVKAYSYSRARAVRRGAVAWGRRSSLAKQSAPD